MKRKTLIPHSFALLVLLAGLALIPATVGVMLAMRAISLHRASDAIVESYSDFLSAVRDTEDSEERKRFLEMLSKFRGRFHPRAALLPTTHVDMWIVDKDGKILASMSPKPLPMSWAWAPHPVSPSESVEIPVPRFKPARLFVWKLPGAAEEYLVYYRFIRLAQWTPYLVILAFLLSIAPVSLCGLVVLFYLRKKAKIAARVLRELRAGNLKARFPVKRFDEVGRMMHAFNEMADDIEGLVERVSLAEKSRKELLQELAHDVRTPLASLSITVSTLWKKRDALPSDYLNESLNHIRQEVDYFRQLIEDLFLLAEVNGPKYTPNTEAVDPVEVLRGEIKTVGEGSLNDRNVRFLLAGDSPSFVVRTDSFLIRRLFRNVLENARRFAKASVKVTLEEKGDLLRVVIRDDGPGFTDETLRNFGERRTSRFLDTTGEGKFSLGLGSVIVKTIVTVHGGTLTPSNWSHADGTLGGAEISFTIKVEKIASARRLAS